MREIKFKVFDRVSGKVSDPFALFGEFTLLGAVFAWVDHVRGGQNERCGLDALNDLVVMQYTGLKDKNGVEIYEGDIVNHNGIGIGHISYNDKHAAYKIVFKGTTRKWLIDMLEREIREIEVIGNIYENPELLKSPD